MVNVDRRALIGALSLAAAGATPARAQEPPPVADRIGEAASVNRFRVEFDGARFSGEGWELLLREAEAAQFVCIGEEHGVAENPKLAAQLLRDARYERACVEISPPMAAELDVAAREGLDGLRRLFSDPGANVAFFGMREEAEWLVAARAALAGDRQAIWGLDYEVGADRRIIRNLGMKRKPARAREALAVLEAASNRSWAQYAETRNPQFIYSFAGDPALVRAVREAWPNADEETEIMLETLEETFAINRLWVEGRGYDSNLRRAQLNRRNLRRYWAAQDGLNPKVVFKFGASHMVRGLSHTHVFDIGTQIAELAETLGRSSFHLMVVPGAGAQHAQFDPSAWTYRPASAETYADQGLTPLISAAFPDAFTLIDLRALRPLASGERRNDLAADLVRTIHGFDALLVMTGSTASSNL